MKITIDTKEDSHEDIKKVISMLQHLVGDEKVYSNSNEGNIFESSKPEVSGNVFGNMFENNPDTPEDKELLQNPEMADLDKEEKEVPEIIPY